MTDHEKLVMRNIIYAVETGGQVYGQKNYADFTEAYTNSSSEPVSYTHLDVYKRQVYEIPFTNQTEYFAVRTY